MEELFAIRGGKQLSERELQSHLALATRLQNVGVLLGAGASRSAGGRTMAEAWSDFRNQYADSVEWLRDHAYLSEDEAAAESSVNIESKLSDLNVSESDLRRRRAGEELNELIQHRNNLYRAVVRGALLDGDNWCDATCVIDNQGLQIHRRLLSNLLSTRQPGQAAPVIFTTNYDLAVEWAAESTGLRTINGFSGLHCRSFQGSNFDLSYRNVQGRGEARFGSYHLYLVKLHGSLSWVADERLFVRELSAEAAEPRWRSFIENEDSDWPGFLVFPGSMKYMDTSGYVFGELFRRFADFLARPQTCLVACGHSFRDEHINRLLLSGLHNPTLQIILYIADFCDAEFGGGDDAQQSNQWLRRLAQARFPTVTFVGSGARAYLSALVDDFPEPALIDDQAARERRLIALLEESAASSQPQPREAEFDETEMV